MIKELAFPTNTSWKQFKGNWKNVTAGGIKYLLKHPFSGPQILIPRLQFALQKKSLKHPVKTPEGFTLKTNSELLVYTQIFVEQNLYYKPLIKQFKYFPNPIIVDVGYNCGFVSIWLKQINSTAIFFGIEVLEQHIERAREIERELYRHTYRPIEDIGFNPNTTIFHNASWNKTGEKVKIKVADRINVSDDGFEIETLAVDDIPALLSPVFLLKIDTDGSNIKVLEGSKEVLKSCVWVLIEEDPGVYFYIKKNLKDWKIEKITNCDLVIQNPFYA